MALKNNKIVNLTAESLVGDVVVARFSASANSDTDVNTAYSEQILDTAVYNKNKTEVRKDIADFRQLIYKLEDELESENEVEEEPVEEPEEPVGE